jgi:hypothetical protein
MWILSTKILVGLFSNKTANSLLLLCTVFGHTHINKDNAINAVFKAA